MKLPLQSRVFLVGFLPGFLFIICFSFFYNDCNFSFFKEFAKDISLFLFIAIVTMSFVIGHFFDSVRNLLIERIICNILHGGKKMNIDFFKTGLIKEIDRFDTNCFILYVINVNLALSLFTILIIILFGWTNRVSYNLFLNQQKIIYILITVIVILFYNAITLRNLILKRANSRPSKDLLPHDYVYTRIGLSKIDGVGVIAICNIPKNTYVFRGDRSELIWVGQDEIEFDKLPDLLKKIYNDFSVIKYNSKIIQYGCPDNFNNMTISWYLNNSNKPNVACDKVYDFYTIEDISIGEELTVDYKTFNDEEISRY